MQPHRQQPTRNVLPDLIIPALAFAFVIYYLTTITEVPWISQASAVFVGTLLVLAIIALGMRTASRIRRGQEKISFHDLLTDVPTQVKRIVLLGLTIAYLFLLELLGFTLTTFLFIFSAIIILSSIQNWKTAATVAAGCALGGYVIFILLFETRFPMGFIENSVKALLRGS